MVRMGRTARVYRAIVRFTFVGILLLRSGNVKRRVPTFYEIWRLAPDAASDVCDQAQLGPLLFFGEEIAFHGGGEAALRA